jgi:hypothetical protein
MEKWGRLRVGTSVDNEESVCSQNDEILQKVPRRKPTSQSPADAEYFNNSHEYLSRIEGLR